MIGATEALLARLETSGTDLRIGVQTTIAFAQEHGLERALLAAAGSRNTLGAKWLRAALVELLEGSDAASHLWRKVVGVDGREIPDVVLHRARQCARAGDLESAAANLRLALQQDVDYNFLVRAEALAAKVRSWFGGARRIRLALLSSTSMQLLRGVLETLCLRDGFDPVIYEHAFGAYMQEVLQRSSGLERFQPDFVAILLNWRDLGLRDTSDEAAANSAFAHMKALWQSALDRTSARLLWFTIVPPVCDAYYALSSLRPGGRAHTIRKINDALLEHAPDRVTVIDAERIAVAHPCAWEDAISWSAAKVYPAPAALPAVGEHILSYVRADLGLSRKLLLLDLDNTLWGGTIGEDGLDGIHLGPPSAIGERYQDLHRYLKALKERGVLLGVVSKNNSADASAVFRQHQGAVLQLDDFVVFEANWNDKATNIRDIAARLRLGTESFVFLDDNPAERGAVRGELPDVVVPEISGEPSESIAALERGLYFQATRLTSEDLARSASYLASAGQQEIHPRCGDVDQYLADLGMRIEHGPVDAGTCARVTQLINKTNQFNLTTRRYRQEEVERRMTSQDYWFRWYRLSDRFADHGLIAVLLAAVSHTEWTVDTWLMSCRVIGRGVEAFMFRNLLEGARRSGARRLRAHYIPTAKNKLVENLLPQFGFTATDIPGEFGLDVAAAVLPECRFLSVETGVGAL